jgi:DNA-binding NarL/FixJ family response regulator
VDLDGGKLAMKPDGSGFVLVVDGDEHARRRTAECLAGAGFAVRETASGEEALREARAERPLAVLSEVRLPGLSGYEVCRRLKDELDDDVPVIFLSVDRTEPSDKVAGLLLGADDYLVKPYVPDELVARVHAVLRRAASTAESGIEAHTADGLTRRETEVLNLLAQGLEPAEIAERLVISPKTVAGHIERILKKLHVHSRAAAIAFAYREGLVAP